MPKNISDDVKGAKSIKAILGNLKAIAQGSCRTEKSVW